MRGTSESGSVGRAAGRRLTPFDVIRGDHVLRGAVAAGVVFVAAYAVLTWLGRHGATGATEYRTAAAALSVVVLGLTAGVMLAAAWWRRDRRESARIWLLLALATALTTGGWVTWSVDFPIADVLFVGAFVAAVGGFFAALRPGHRSGRFWLGFDLVLVAAGAGALLWRVFAQFGLGTTVTADHLTAVVYPVCGLATLLFLAPMGVFAGRRLPASLTLVGWAYAVAAACGLGTFTAAAAGSFAADHPLLSTLYQVPVALLALGALTALRSPESDGIHFPAGRDVTMLPSLIAAGAAVIGLVVVDARLSGVQVPLMVAALVVIGLLTRLGLVVRERTRLADQLAEALAEQQRLAVTDALTGLANRRYFEQSLATEVVRARRNHRPLGLVVLDLDHFKSINDQHGHAAGDAVLVQVGTLLQVITRDADVVARYGGEEFVWLLPDTDEEGAAKMGERLRTALATHPVALPSGEPLWITGSIGVAAAQDTVDATVLAASADEAMYRAKAGGRNRVVRASELESHQRPVRPPGLAEDAVQPAPTLSRRGRRV